MIQNKRLFHLAIVSALIAFGNPAYAEEWWLGGLFAKTCTPTDFESSIGALVAQLNERGNNVEILPVADPVNFYLLQGPDQDGAGKPPVIVAKKLHECTFGQEYARFKTVISVAKAKLGFKVESKLSVKDEIKVIRLATKDFNEQFDRELTAKDFATKFNETMKRAKGG